jgi:hypothetical protein
VNNETGRFNVGDHALSNLDYFGLAVELFTHIGT